MSQVISPLHIVQHITKTQDVDFISLDLVFRPLYIVSICSANHNILWLKNQIFYFLKETKKMTPFTLYENVLSTTLFGKSAFELDKAFDEWKNKNFKNFPNKIVQILNISFAEIQDNYSMNIIYQI